MKKRKGLGERPPIVDGDDPAFKIRADDRIKSLFGEKETFTPSKLLVFDMLDLFAVSEIDLTIMETKAREKIHELVREVMAKVTGEQKARAEMSVLYDRFKDRLEKLEDILQTSNNRPAIAVEMDNKLAEVRSHVYNECSEMRVVLKGIKNDEDVNEKTRKELRMRIEQLERAMETRDVRLN